ncbi:MAG TPA: RHS repeat-associated core domain-containing protein [Usitatibacter sp.]|jgi:RHS repeat-associated protein|nr:RHS repeat-associated core domain-containing protein [Usitatibacter sp.]
MRCLWRFCILLGVLVGLEASASTTTYFHNDLTGSPLAATDSNGHVLWRESYRPYGERLVNSASAKGNDVWFTSRRQDAETGLVYMGARYYDPVAGRFASIDPKPFDATNALSFGRYTYGNDNPYKYVDPDGRQAQTVIIVGGVLLIGGTVYFATSGPERQAQTRKLVSDLGTAVANLLHSESTPSENSDTGGTQKEPGKNSGEGPGERQPDSAPNPREFEDPKNIPSGWEWRGKGQPGSREGAYHNPDTGESMHDDRTHPAGKPPHWTYTDPKGTRWDNFGDGWKSQ